MIARRLCKVAEQVTFRVRQGCEGREAEGQHTEVAGLMTGAVQSVGFQDDQNAAAGPADGQSCPNGLSSCTLPPAIAGLPTPTFVRFLVSQGKL